MTFQSPGWLWALLLVPVLAVALVAWARASRRAAGDWADPAVMDVRPSARTRRWRGAAAVLALLAVVAGLFALARPSVETTSEQNRSSVMLTMDISESMKKTDLQPSRLAAAVDAAERFADEAPKGTAIGITTFADRTAVILAPTTDRDAVRRALAGLGELRVGTALGEGVTTSLSALQAAGAVSDPPPSNPSDSPGRILLLTDGANSIPNATSPEAAAQRAAQLGVPIYSILLGDDPGRPDQPLPSETLSAMSSTTGGIFAQTTTTADLQAVFADIGSVVAPVDELRELSVWFAGLALALLVGAGACAALSRPRPPRGRTAPSLGSSA